jgi:hypothetical protein
MYQFENYSQVENHYQIFKLPNLQISVMPNENPFKLIEPNGQVPEHLKKALVSEIDTIRNGSTLVELFVGNFVNAITASFSSGNESINE